MIMQAVHVQIPVRDQMVTLQNLRDFIEATSDLPETAQVSVDTDTLSVQWVTGS